MPFLKAAENTRVIFTSDNGGVVATAQQEQQPGARKKKAAGGPKGDQYQPQLFNLADDSAETHNVAAKHPEVVRRAEFNVSSEWHIRAVRLR